MTENRPKAELQGPPPARSGREDRLAEALRANLARRKAQSRAKAQDCGPAPDQTAAEPKE
jgi:hypothetical protein